MHTLPPAAAQGLGWRHQEAAGGLCWVVCPGQGRIPAPERLPLQAAQRGACSTGRGDGMVTPLQTQQQEALKQQGPLKAQRQQQQQQLQRSTHAVPMGLTGGRDGQAQGPFASQGQGQRGLAAGGAGHASGSVAGREVAAGPSHSVPGCAGGGHPAALVLPATSNVTPEWRNSAGNAPPITDPSTPRDQLIAQPPGAGLNAAPAPRRAAPAAGFGDRPPDTRTRARGAERRCRPMPCLEVRDQEARERAPASGAAGAWGEGAREGAEGAQPEAERGDAVGGAGPGDADGWPPDWERLANKVVGLLSVRTRRAYARHAHLEHLAQSRPRREQQDEEDGEQGQGEQGQEQWGQEGLDQGGQEGLEQGQEEQEQGQHPPGMGQDNEVSMGVWEGSPAEGLAFTQVDARL